MVRLADVKTFLSFGQPQRHFFRVFPHFLECDRNRIEKYVFPIYSIEFLLRNFTPLHFSEGSRFSGSAILLLTVWWAY